MKARKFSEARNAFIVKQGADGVAVVEFCRKAGISKAASTDQGQKRLGRSSPVVKRY